MLSEYYDSPYFFSSRAFQEGDFQAVELTKVYRQSDSRFLDILNKIRENRCLQADLDELNRRYLPEFEPEKEDNYIQLTTHNSQALKINTEELDDLPGDTHTFAAEIKGEFPPYSYPTETELVLKEGAQVMLVKNDSPEHHYVNGSLAEVVRIDDTLDVKLASNGETISIERAEWCNTRYILNPETNNIEEEVLGTFVQYPLKLAWAITIHKSQGLTFDHAIIDASAAFAHGQTYVALSRCRSLEGLVLSEPVPPSAIINDRLVKNFTSRLQQYIPDSEQCKTMKQNYIIALLDDLFDFIPLRQAIERMERLMTINFPDKCAQLIADYQAENERGTAFPQSIPHTHVAKRETRKRHAATGAHQPRYSLLRGENATAAKTVGSHVHRYRQLRPPQAHRRNQRRASPADEREAGIAEIRQRERLPCAGLPAATFTAPDSRQSGSSPLAIRKTDCRARRHQPSATL